MITSKEYSKIVEKSSPKSKTALCCVRAFFIGGGICAAGQYIYELLRLWGLDEITARTVTSVTLIFAGVLLTALGVYDKIARKAGAGTLVPITGFANAMSSSAIEFRGRTPYCAGRLRQNSAQGGRGHSCSHYGLCERGVGVRHRVQARGLYCRSRRKNVRNSRPRDRLRRVGVGDLRRGALGAAPVRDNAVLTFHSKKRHKAA